MEKNLEDECPICLEINGHNECIILNCCNKYIHKECFDHWMYQNLDKPNNIKCLFCYKTNIYIDNFRNNNYPTSNNSPTTSNSSMARNSPTNNNPYIINITTENLIMHRQRIEHQERRKSCLFYCILLICFCFFGGFIICAIMWATLN